MKTLLRVSISIVLMNLAIADTAITVWKWKLFYNFWRPITAIQLADTDPNPLTAPDPAWLPLINNPAYPDYPSGLNGAGGAALAVIGNFFGANTSFVVDLDNATMVGVVRAFPNVAAAGNEIVDTRVYSGIHFRFADADALELGSRVANHVIANAFQPLHGNKNGQRR